MPERVPLEGSQPPSDPRVRRLRAADPQATVDVTLVLRRRPGTSSPEEAAAMLSGRAGPPRARDAEVFAADPEDLRLVEAFAAEHGLRVTDVRRSERAVKVSGTVAQVEKAFGTALGLMEGPEGPFLGYDGPLSVPAAIAGRVVAVLGLNQRAAARR